MSQRAYPIALSQPLWFGWAAGLAVALMAWTVVPLAKAQSPLPDDFNPGANGTVYALAVQTDGKILAGGAFTTLGGQARNHIGRLNQDGTDDPVFNTGA